MDWRKNLYHFEEQPPQKAWEMISRELDEDVPALRDKLYGFEAVPPSNTWLAVASRINEKESGITPVIWYKRRWNVAAAAAIAAVLLGVFYINRDKVPPGISTAVINPIPQSSLSTPEVAPTVPSAPEASSTPQAIAPAEKDDKPVILAESTTRETAKRKKPSKTTQRDSNYLYFTASNGETVRLSYKLQKLLPAIKNKKHNEILDQWSTTLESSAFAPSGSNFFDIVDMLKMVEQRLP